MQETERKVMVAITRIVAKKRKEGKSVLEGGKSENKEIEVGKCRLYQPFELSHEACEYIL